MLEKISSNFNASILVAEDYPLSQVFMKKLLEKMGCTVEIAVDGHEALQKIAENKFDFIFMDLHLPGIDGVNVTKEVRKNSNYSHIPIIALTADVLEGVKETCIEAGMNDYLSKPIKGSDVEKTLKQYLNV